MLAGGSLGLVLATLLVGTPILLAVDIARNIRQLRRLADREAASSA